jgi:hypothetical protein
MNLLNTQILPLQSWQPVQVGKPQFDSGATQPLFADVPVKSPDSLKAAGGVNL